MKFNTGLNHGDIITNNELREIFACGNMGGMRRSKTTNTLVIVSDHTKGPYEDKWIGDVLHYTGMGKKGDQEIDKNQNRTLNQSDTNGVEVHLFEVFKETEYIYIGKVNMANKPYQEKQKDEDGLLRNVWIFPVKLTEGISSSIDENILKENYERKAKKAKKLTEEELLNKAIEGQSSKVSVRKTETQTYVRNQYVIEYAKRRANGICQLCDKEAPFKNKQGEPYLEIHHINWLAKGGKDTIDNTVALCPNCHRKMHIMNIDEDRRKLSNLI